jgi:hypothetical protein
MISLVFATVLMAAGAPAASEAGPPATTAAKAAPKPDKNGMVCVKEAVLGSRMKSRICMTQAEWDDRQRQDREMVEKAQSLKPLNGN